MQIVNVQMVASQLDMKKNSIWKIIPEDFDIWKVCAKMVPRLLNDNQKECQLQVCQDIIKQSLNWIRIALVSHHWWWNKDFWVWPWNQAPELLVEVSDVNVAKESKTVKVKIHLDHLFLCEGYHTQNSRQTAWWSINKSTRESYHVFFAQCPRRDERWSRTNHRCFSMTMHLLTTPCVTGNSCPKGTLLYWIKLPICLILVCMTFFFSSSLRGWSKGSILKAWKSSNELYDRAKRHPRRILRAVNRSMAEKDEKVH